MFRSILVFLTMMSCMVVNSVQGTESQIEIKSQSVRQVIAENNFKTLTNALSKKNDFEEYTKNEKFFLHWKDLIKLDISIEQMKNFLRLVHKRIHENNPMSFEEFNRTIFTYGPRKIILGGGKKDELNNDTTDDSWMTVDINPKLQPDLLLDLTQESSYETLLKKYGQFDLMFEEYIWSPARHVILKHAKELLKSDGIYVGLFCLPCEKNENNKQIDISYEIWSFINNIKNKEEKGELSSNLRDKFEKQREMFLRLGDKQVGGEIFKKIAQLIRETEKDLKNKNITILDVGSKSLANALYHLYLTYIKEKISKQTGFEIKNIKVNNFPFKEFKDSDQLRHLKEMSIKKIKENFENENLSNLYTSTECDCVNDNSLKLEGGGTQFSFMAIGDNPEIEQKIQLTSPIQKEILLPQIEQKIDLKSPVQKEILLPEITIEDIQNYFQTPNLRAIAIGLEPEKKILAEHIIQINEIIKSINEEGKESDAYSTAISDYYMNPRGRDKNTSKEYRQVLYVMLSDLIKKKFFSKQENMIQLQNIIAYYSTRILMTKIQSMRLWNLNPPYERKIQDYKGDKLLLCGGRILFFDLKYKTDESYYMVDGNPLSFPDLILNLTTENASNMLLQKTGGFDVILNEYCPTEVCLEVNKYAAKLLKSGGIFVSRICASDFEDAKKELLETGFSKIILSNLRLTGRMNPIHDFKNLSKKEIIQTFMNISDKNSEAIKCKLGNKELNMIYFVAIK